VTLALNIFRTFTRRKVCAQCTATRNIRTKPLGRPWQGYPHEGCALHKRARVYILTHAHQVSPLNLTYIVGTTRGILPGDTKANSRLKPASDAQVAFVSQAEMSRPWPASPCRPFGGLKPDKRRCNLQFSACCVSRSTFVDFPRQTQGVSCSGHPDKQAPFVSPQEACTHLCRASLWKLHVAFPACSS
jgi:hypothetical protein